MTRSLDFKLVLAFLLVSIIGVALTVAFARWATYQEFDRLVLEQARDDFVAEASTYYRANGSWQGFGEYLHFRVPPPAPQDRPGAPPGPGGQPPPGQQPGVGSQPAPQPAPYVFALADRDGVVVMSAGPYLLGDQVPANQLAGGLAIEVDGQVVGTALATGESPQLAPQEAHYLRRTNRVSLYAGLAATLVALVLGVILARTLTRPLGELTAATRAMAQGDLEQRVPVRSQDELGELATAFNQMSADLAQANELRRQMTADIAHDLRTPLTVMAGYLEALRDGVLPPSPDRFETLYKEALLLRRLVEDLRTLSLADAGELTLNREPVPPRTVLEQAAAAYHHQAGQAQITLAVRAGSSLPMIDVDPDRMAQVLGNLVANALRHTPAGGRVLLEAGQRGNDLWLSVRDTGEGIAPDELPHVFDRFHRGDEARQTHEGESGLGLAIAKSLVELHGGTIAVESTPGQGTTFSIALTVVS
jgi:signal transduction histidine kinase